MPSVLSSEQIKKIAENAQAIITGSHFVYAKKADGWYHGRDYVNKDALYLDPRVPSDLCCQIAGHFACKGVEVVVGPTVGGVILSQLTADWLNIIEDRVPGTERIKAVFADEEDILEKKEYEYPVMHNELDRFNHFANFVGDITVETFIHGPPGSFDRKVAKWFRKAGTRRVIKRGYDKHVKDKRCLIVEDILNTGLTVRKTCEAVLAVGGTISGIGALADRSNGQLTAESFNVPELFVLLKLNMEMFKEDECPVCRERGFQSVRTDLGKGKEFLQRKGLL